MFNFNKDKIKQIEVSPNSNYVIWREDLTNIVRDTTITVASGCVALYFVDGALATVNTPGRSVIKSKEEEKRQSKLELICVNTEKPFEVFCGVGDIPYVDDEISFETSVGAFGECKIKIVSPSPFYAVFGRAPVSAGDVDAYIKPKLNEIMSTSLAQLLQRHDYNDIMTKQSEFAGMVKDRFAHYLINIGLQVFEFSLKGINFSPEYLNARKAYFDAQNAKEAEKEARRQEERRRRNELEDVRRLADIANGLNPTITAPAATPNISAPVSNSVTVGGATKFCSQCGTKLETGAKFCSNCGKKI